jgi:adsorption protein B
VVGVVWFIDSVTRELVTFAAVMLLIGGLDDLAVDLVHFARRLRYGRQHAFRLEPPVEPGRIAVFVAAWHESEVIGRMLSSALGRLRHGNYRIYVGCYPNDPDTVDAVAAVAERDARIRLVIGPKPGPTTKADNLNAVWHAMHRADAAEEATTRAVVLHDAEDVLHPEEIGVYDALIGIADVVQIPVVPLLDPHSRWIAGHYADEFAEAHGRQITVRTALGAGMPLAGTGCAIATPMLARIAADRDGDPFDSASLTEDYELGLRIGELGGRASFVRITGDDGELVAVSAFFPGTFRAAVKQKARWMTGIALAGWDRTGWARAGALSDHWMRMRDRRGPLSMLVLGVAYLAILCWGMSLGAHQIGGGAPLPMIPLWLMLTNLGLLGWRMLMRATATGAAYGWRQGLLAIPRFLVGNVVALAATRRALGMYLGLLRGRALRWEKTRHVFPDLAAAPR